MAAFVALFRGINVGGNHKVSMADLKKLHEELGLKRVTAYIQSGNIVFTSEQTDQKQLEQQIEEGFAGSFGYRVNVMVRSEEQIHSIIANNPFQEQAEKEPKWLQVLFLAAAPVPTAEEDLRQAYSGPELFRVQGHEMYIFYPESIGHSKLTASLLDKKLKAPATARNWNTILKLQQLMEAASA